MFTEDDLLPLSGLQHVAFCERRWALVHIESIWVDNHFTAEGSVLHERAHSGDIESRPGVLVRRTLPVRSFHLGISGQTDIVEFHPVPLKEARGPASGVALEGRTGKWQPFPVEYKRSRDKARSRPYHVQLCAQAICLEEMLNTAIPEGAIYDATARRRQPVLFDSDLRALTARLAARMHELWIGGRTPPPIFTKACRSCSLLELCQPEAISRRPSVADYLREACR
jgi:CRISPR-associated exonuclease Cas4